MTLAIAAKESDRVIVQYEGKLETGEVFESSGDSAPMDFKIGDQMVLPALERAFIGMKTGQTRTISIPPEEGYGPHHEELVITVRRDTLGEGDIKAGMVVAMNMEREGKIHRLPALVLEAGADRVKVDFNHPLAGKELFYTITLTRIEPAADAD